MAVSTKNGYNYSRQHATAYLYFCKVVTISLSLHCCFWCQNSSVLPSKQQADVSRYCL